MKKVICTLFVIGAFLMAIPSQAQIKLGVKGGVNLNNASFSSSNMKGKNYTGFYVGPMVDIKLPFFGFGVDGALLYSQKGIDLESSNTSTVTVKELAIPINAKYYLGLGRMASFFLFAGPQFAFNLDKSGNDGNGKHDYSFKSSNISINLGLGLSLLSHLQASANYNIPCGKTADFQYNNSGQYIYNAKTKGWQFSLAYLF